MPKWSLETPFPMVQNKQLGCETCGGTSGWMRQDLPIEHPNFGQLVLCPECGTKSQQSRNQQAGQLTGVLKAKTFDNFGILSNNKNIVNEVREWALSPMGWLTMHGEYGAGKTHLAAAIANTYPEISVYYNLPDIIGWMQNDPSKVETILRKMTYADILILDELSDDCIRSGSWTRSQMQRLFDGRYREAETKALVICSNTKPNEFSDALQFIGSRMQHEGFLCLELEGDNRPQAIQLSRLAKKQNIGD